MRFELTDVSWDDEVARTLRDAQQSELNDLYGRPDQGATMTGADVVAMVVGRLDGRPVACGALRDASNLSDEVGPGAAELKRMYVAPPARGQGYSWDVLRGLESRAGELGFDRVVLETGLLQPAAIALYEAAGYQRVPSYGAYRCAPDSVCYAKDLPRRS
ncbi:MAG: GNAT family N-acetyltransferase [Cellulomonas sp.]|nr:GNAT family N-acetyltransferase [Cellulomonas sp.]